MNRIRPLLLALAVALAPTVSAGAVDKAAVERQFRGWIEEGPQHMDGHTALWYSRSRATTSDYDREKLQERDRKSVV